MKVKNFVYKTISPEGAIRIVEADYECWSQENLWKITEVEHHVRLVVTPIDAEKDIFLYTYMITVFYKEK